MIDDRDNTPQQLTGDNRSPSQTVRVETLATPILSTKLPSLLDTQTTPPVSGLALATSHSLALSDVEGPLATAFFQSLHFFIRLRANSRRFRDIPKINRYKITLFLLESLRRPDLQALRKGGAARVTLGVLPSTCPPWRASLLAKAPKDRLRFRFSRITGHESPVTILQRGEAKAKGEGKPARPGGANRDNLKFKNRRNPLQRNDIPKVNRDKNTTSGFLFFRPIPALAKRAFLPPRDCKRPREAGKLVTMPELPDIAAYLAALEPRIVGQRLERVRLANVFLLRTVQPPVQAVEGHFVRSLRRIGKHIAIEFDNSMWLVLHLMIAGRLHWKTKGAKLAGKNQLAALDFPNGSLVLTEAGSKRRASLHVFGSEAEMQTIDPGGLDVFSIDLEAFRAALTAENRTLKRALTDPRILSGIGNAYSDEILHAAQLSPIQMTQKLTPKEWQQLFVAARETLQLWIGRLRAEAAEDFPENVTAFRKGMAVHGRYRKPCPRCGEPIQRIRYADNETNYCARCQTGGRVLADRALSRLLGADWPRTLEELEALRRR